jgi:hypothetical protein
MTRVELRQMLNKVSMKKEQDPASIFEQLSSIKNRYNTKKNSIDEADLIAGILDAAPCTEGLSSSTTNEGNIELSAHN